MPEPAKLKKDVSLGVNVLDLFAMSDFVRLKVLKTGNVDLHKPITYGEGGDERFVELKCPTLRAALLLDFLRNEGRVERSTVCRAYIRRGTGEWTKLSASDVLCVPNGEHFDLNPKHFPVVVEAEPYSGGGSVKVFGRR